MKIRALLLFFFTVAVLASCKKDNFNYPTGTVGISKIVYFPDIAIKGDRLIILNQGATYTDPGTVADLGGKPTTYTTNPIVSTSTPGVYVVNYSASNPQGFSASDWRTVVVIGSDVSTNDFSGTYVRSATGISSTWTKTASGVYSVENPGGVGAGVGLHVIAVNYTGTKISIPQQISPDYGQVSSSNETYTAGPPTKYSWIFYAGGYGLSLKTFTK